MEDNFKPKRLPTTVPGKTLRMMFILVGIAGLAWMILTIWFGIAIFENKNQGFIKMKILSDSNINLLKKHTGLVDKLAEWPQSLDSAIETTVDLFAESMNIFTSQYGSRKLSVNSDVYKTLQGLVSESTKILLSKLFIVFLYTPIFLIMMLVMIVDGLGQRDIRKFSGSRESSFIFHQFKRLPEWIIYSVLLIYLSLPLQINPEFILIATIMLVGILVMQTIKGYKKYA
jgi:integrating conjugative element membrane protein (TIGR03747 family)